MTCRGGGEEGGCLLVHVFGTLGRIRSCHQNSTSQSHAKMHSNKSKCKVLQLGSNPAIYTDFWGGREGGSRKCIWESNDSKNSLGLEEEGTQYMQ